MPRIRPVSARDLPDLLPLITALAAHHGDTACISQNVLERDFLSNPPWLYGLVADYDVAVVAYAALCPVAQLHFGERGLDIHHLHVDQGHRGRGFGRAMIEACVQKAATLGCTYVTVSTTKNDVAAQDVYRACGFRHTTGTRFRREV